MLINFPHLINDINVVVVATELTLAGARDAIRLLSWLKSNASQARTIVVANKIHAGVSEISKSDFEASIERKINYFVPFDVKAAANAAKLGQTFVAANRSTKAAAAIREIGEAVMGSADDNGAAMPEAVADKKKSLLGKIDLKSLLSTKAKAAAAAESA